MPDLRPSSPGDVVSCRLVTLGVAALAPLRSFAQQDADQRAQNPGGHVLWIIPDFRTSPELQEYKPIAAREKFRIAAQDSFDHGTTALAAAFAGGACVDF
jgi:hypothetical protein